MRGGFCIDCRTALERGEACDGGARHRVVDLGNAEGRRRAVDSVWGPPSMRTRRIAKVAGTGGAAGGLGSLGDCGSCGAVDGEAAGAIMVVLVAAIAAVLIYWIVVRIAHYVRDRRARPRPQGVPARKLGGKLGLAGRVERATEAPAPISDEPCAAWGVTLRHDRALGGDVTCIDGGTRGMDIVLDDGRVITVPPGRIRLGGDGARNHGSAHTYVQSLDPDHTDDESFAPIPHDDAHELLLRIGDRVEIVGAVEERPDPSAPAGGYRDAPPTVLAIAGTPVIVRAT